MDNSLSLRNHINIHLRNPQHNYIISENCKHCKRDRRISYGTNFKTHQSLDIHQITPITYHHMYRTIIPTNQPHLTSNRESISSDTDTVYGFPDEDFDLDFSSNSISLQMVNNNSILSIYIKNNNCMEKCTICYEYLKSFQIIRTVICNHQFHYQCLDKWLESRRNCPLCRYEFFG